ncbi:MAG: alpha/beta hydrolase, partial [Mycobacteriales bacterium]
WDIVSGCAGWPVNSKWEPHPWQVSADFTPTLLLSGAHDVATPRPFAEAVAQTIPRSALLRWPGDGHAAWPAHDACSVRAATQYLLTVQLPNPASCAG